ncbi:matrilin-3, partial [Caerostris extrusa]
NFCALNPCGENEVCEDLPTDPGNVKCSCKEGYYYDGQSCQEASLCDIPSTLSCQQICNSSTEECECHPGFALQSDNKTCKANDLTKPCKQKCGVGICVTIDSKDVCVCPSTHVAVGLSCVDLCTAKHIPTGVCPDDECAADDKMGFKCKCEGNYTYDQNGVTCRKKLMCSEGDGTKTCAKYKARCVEDFNHADGYRCECDKGQAMDNDGICKDKCEVSKQKEECDDRKATCDMDGFEAVCKCPPLLTLGSDGKCTEFAKVSYSGELPLALDRYALKKLLSPSKANLKDDTINYDAIRKDLRSSMHMMYGDNYKFADIVNCRIVDKTLKCLVEVQFQSNPEDQVKLITDASSCLSFDKNTCFIPPRLLLDKKNFKSDGFTETDPCMDDIKNLNCGPETECKKIEGKGFNYECSCSPGFESFNTYLPLSDSNTVIHHCNDINECLQQKACPNRTRCLNTYGSYECVCQNGFRPPTDKSDPKISNCVEVCHSKVCKHGKCEVLGEAFRCRCDDGYTGLDCGQAIQNMAGYEGMKSALIVLSVLVVPLMLIVAFLIHKYYVLKKILQ